MPDGSADGSSGADSTLFSTVCEGATSKKIWVSEFGWESNAVGYQGQADNLTTGFNLLKNDSRIALAIFFSLTDWPGASWGLYEFGNFAPADQKLSFQAFKNQVNCPGSAFPADLLATPDCLGNVNFNWTNSGSGWFIDVSTDHNWQLADSVKVNRFNQSIINTGSFELKGSMLTTKATFALSPKFTNGLAKFKCYFVGDTLILRGLSVASSDHLSIDAEHPNLKESIVADSGPATPRPE